MKTEGAVLAIASLFLLTTPSFAQNPLPAPWQHTDVGDVGIPGDATQGANGDFLVNGAGSDIWGNADSFHFMYQSMDHDGDLSADNPSGDATNPFAKVGIMLRLTLDPTNRV